MATGQKPLILINYKLYTEATGAKAVALTKALEEAARGARAEVAVAVQAADLYRVSQATTLPVWAQHVDPHAPGAGTGWTLAEAVKEAGAVGTLLNHAEHRLQLADLDDTVHRLKHLNLQRVVCTNNVCTTRAAAALRPEYVAIEPPELIGGDVSVTTADPGIVSESVKAAREVDPRVRVLCGAGVKTGEDVAAALKLGAHGVLLASGITKAKDPAAALRDLLSGIP